jgi:hypothetical protein
VRRKIGTFLGVGLRGVLKCTSFTWNLFIEMIVACQHVSQPKASVSLFQTYDGCESKYNTRLNTSNNTNNQGNRISSFYDTLYLPTQTGFHWAMLHFLPTSLWFPGHIPSSYLRSTKVVTQSNIESHVQHGFQAKCTIGLLVRMSRFTID